MFDKRSAADVLDKFTSSKKRKATSGEAIAASSSIRNRTGGNDVDRYAANAAPDTISITARRLARLSAARLQRSSQGICTAPSEQDPDAVRLERVARAIRHERNPYDSPAAENFRRRKALEAEVESLLQGIHRNEEDLESLRTISQTRGTQRDEAWTENRNLRKQKEKDDAEIADLKKQLAAAEKRSTSREEEEQAHRTSTNTKLETYDVKIRDLEEEIVELKKESRWIAWYRIRAAILENSLRTFVRWNVSHRRTLKEDRRRQARLLEAHVKEGRRDDALQTVIAQLLVSNEEKSENIASLGATVNSQQCEIERLKTDANLNHLASAEDTKSEATVCSEDERHALYSHVDHISEHAELSESSTDKADEAREPRGGEEESEGDSESYLTEESEQDGLREQDEDEDEIQDSGYWSFLLGGPDGSAPGSLGGRSLFDRITPRSPPSFLASQADGVSSANSSLEKRMLASNTPKRNCWDYCDPSWPMGPPPSSYSGQSSMLPPSADFETPMLAEEELSEFENNDVVNSAISKQQPKKRKAPAVDASGGTYPSSFDSQQPNYESIDGALKRHKRDNAPYGDIFYGPRSAEDDLTADKNAQSLDIIIDEGNVKSLNKRPKMMQGMKPPTSPSRQLQRSRGARVGPGYSVHPKSQPNTRTPTGPRHPGGSRRFNKTTRITKPTRDLPQFGSRSDAGDDSNGEYNAPPNSYSDDRAMNAANREERNSRHVGGGRARHKY